MNINSTEELSIIQNYRNVSQIKTQSGKWLNCYEIANDILINDYIIHKGSFVVPIRGIGIPTFIRIHKTWKDVLYYENPQEIHR